MRNARLADYPLLASPHGRPTTRMMVYLHDWARRGNVQSVLGVDGAVVITLRGPNGNLFLVTLREKDFAVTVVEVRSHKERATCYSSRFDDEDAQIREAHFRIISLTESTNARTN